MFIISMYTKRGSGNVICTSFNYCFHSTEETWEKVTDEKLSKSSHDQ